MFQHIRGIWNRPDSNGGRTLGHDSSALDGLQTAESDSSGALDPQYGAPGINASECKYDAFMVKTDSTTPPARRRPSVVRDYIMQSGTSATVNYSVGVRRDAGTVSDVKVTGKITAPNPNAAPINRVEVTDMLTGGECRTLDRRGPEFACGKGFKSA